MFVTTTSFVFKTIFAALTVGYSKCFFEVSLNLKPCRGLLL